MVPVASQAALIAARSDSIVGLMRLPALLVVGVVLLLLAPVGAQAQSELYTDCETVGDASIVQVAGITCEGAQGIVEALLAEPPQRAVAVLAAAGWAPLRARDGGRNEHDLVALRGLETLRIRRRGATPDLDGWAAGRELLFARKKLVGGKRPPRGAVLCTSAFLVRLRSGRLGGLSAAHCGGLRKDRTVHRRLAALRRPPAPGIVLGRVLRMLTRKRPLDALVLRVPHAANRPTSPVIDRGIARPPWRVVATAHPRSNRLVCMSGRTSGIDQCGHILGPEVRRAERFVSAFAGSVVRCTSIVARGGDSGGPVYTAPAANGTVRAIGVAAIIVRPSRRMCFTPIKPALSALRAKLVTAAG
ncbi:MAG: S1 family peptidase [Actinomycetota bacterium]|nr:S1 family peptidase [Actinomycetota bacterium]